MNFTNGNSPGAPRILIVDDEPANRKLLADLVTREGYEAMTAAGGVEALAIIARGSVDLVLLDIMMPEVNGLEVLSELERRGALPALPVVVVTAHEDRSVRISALTAGAIDFVTKPFDRLEVACKIRTLVELKRLRERAVAVVEGALQESDHLRRLSFEQSPVAKIHWNTDFRVTDWNPAAEKLFGYTRAEALGQHGSFLISKDFLPQLDGLRRHLMKGLANESTGDNIARDGRTISCEWHNAPLTSTAGKILGISSVVLDCTERQRLQDALVQSRKMGAIGRLAGGVAHDFNNILSVILSFGSFVRDRLPDGDERKDDIIEVLKAADRGAGLTRHLMTFSRQQNAVKRSTELNDRLVQLHKILSRTVGEHIDLAITPSANPAVVRIDPVQLDQIVLNLAANARDAMPDGGRLAIAITHVSEPGAGTSGLVRLTVSDNGTGMDAQVQQHIFEPFFTTKESGKGTGLGLATCYAIAEDAGGTVAVASASGQGTTVSVELPLCDDPVETARQEDVIPYASRGETVLVAEDEPALREAARRVLENAGYRVIMVADGTEAIAKIDELGAKLDVILTDIIMPGCSGYDVAEHAVRVAPDIAIIFTSGYVNEVTRRNHRDDLPFLWKPVPPADLIRAVALSLAGRISTGTTGKPDTPQASGDSAPDIRTTSAPVSAGPRRRGRILAIDDEENFGKALRRLLGRQHDITLSLAARDALALFTAGEQFDVILCDLGMPIMNGMELHAALQQIAPDQASRVIFLTGGAVTPELQSFLRTSTLPCLYKPFDPDNLRAIINDRIQWAQA